MHLPFLVEGRRRSPNDLEVAEKLARVLAGMGLAPARVEARRHARFVLQRQPTNEVALEVLVSAAETSVDLESLGTELDELEQQTGKHPALRVARALYLPRSRTARAQNSS